MPMLPLENLGGTGLITDQRPFELPPEAWSRADNIIFGKQGASKTKGHVEVLATLTHDPYWLFPWKAATGFSWLYGGLTRMGRIVGSGHSDVTRYTTLLGDDDYNATSASLFSGVNLGDLPLWTYDGEVDPPQSWNSGNGRFEDLPNWQASTFCDLITVVDRYVVALRVKKSGVSFNARMVKWSQAADPGTYPSSWDETDPATGAGEVTLAETPGEIKASALMNNSMLIYKNDSVISMRFVGGQSVFAFDTTFSEFGAISRYAVGVLENAHLVVTEGDVVVHNGVTFESVIDDKVKDLLFNNINRLYLDSLQVVVRKQQSEVWVCFPDSNSSGPLLNKALVWNYSDNTWASRDLQDFTHISSGFIDTTSSSLIFDDAPQTSRTFDEPGSNVPFDKQSATPVFDDLAAADAGNRKMYKLNVGGQFDGTDMACRLERIGLPIIGRDRDGEWKVDLDSVKFLRRVHLKLQADGPVSIYVGGQNTPEGPVTWVGPYSFDPATQYFIDCRIQARFLAFRLDTTTDIDWTLYGYTMDLEVLAQAPR